MSRYPAPLKHDTLQRLAPYQVIIKWAKRNKTVSNFITLLGANLRLVIIFPEPSVWRHGIARVLRKLNDIAFYMDNQLLTIALGHEDC